MSYVLYNCVISIIVYFNFKLPTIMFRVFILGGNCLLLYHVYLAKVGREEWSLWNSFIKKGASALI